MLPKTLALIEDDQEYGEALAQHFQERAIRVDLFLDSADLLASERAYEYGFYVVDLMLPTVDGIDLIKVLRRRTTAGLLVVSGRLAPDTFEQSLGSGADMYLCKPVNFEQVTLAIKAIMRRASAHANSSVGWLLDRAARQLVAPDNARIDLGDGHLALLECFIAAKGQPVSRETLRRGLGRDADEEASDTLNSTIFRLRRRIEKASQAPMRLQARSGLGYVFRAPLRAV